MKDDLNYLLSDAAGSGSSPGPAHGNNVLKTVFLIVGEMAGMFSHIYFHSIPRQLLSLLWFLFFACSSLGMRSSSKELACCPSPSRWCKLGQQQA